MRDREYRAKGKAHAKMTRDGLVERDAATGDEQHISTREQDFTFGKTGDARAGPPPEVGGDSRGHGQSRAVGRPGQEHAPDTAPVDSAADAWGEDVRLAGEPSPRGPAPRDVGCDAGEKRGRQHGAKYTVQFDGRAQAAPPGKLQFTAEERPVGDGKVDAAERKAMQYDTRLERAREKLPTKKKRRIRKEFDIEKGKPRFKLKTEETVLPNGKPPGPVQKVAGAALRAGGAAVHNKIRQAEGENVGVEAGHKGEMLAERGAGKLYRGARQRIKTAPARKVARLERRSTKAHVNAAYQRAVWDNPKLGSNPLSRLMQKRKIRRQYAQAKRAAQGGKKVVQRLADGASKVGAALWRLVSGNKAVLAIVLALAMMLMVIFSSMSSCSIMGLGGLETIMGGSYMAEDADIDNAELAYTEWETDLQLEIRDVETARQGYDEYTYSIADIGHNPYELMAFLTAVYEDFTFPQVEPVLRGIFARQYSLTYTEETETRTRTDTVVDPVTLEESEVEVEYEWRILHVKLAVTPFGSIVTSTLGTPQQREMYNVHLEIRGNRQYVQSPFDFDWLPYVSDAYGWRVHPISGAKDYHKAIDIAVPAGTPILAGFDGTVTVAAYDASYGNYIVVEDGKGLVAKYAHCSSLALSAGASVKTGDVLGRVGSTGDSTGAHVHLEIVKNGQYLNPWYFLENPYSTGIPGMPGGPEFPGDPGSPMGDGSYAALIAEAEKYLGYPYVWGGSSPTTSFDCSGYICWILNQSGVASVGRTTAQGLYNLCTPVSRENARPGDLVFFTGTYSTPNPVSHVGLYVGGGRMIHCGSPISYASIDTAYWQGHFYSFGRL